MSLCLEVSHLYVLKRKIKRKNKIIFEFNIQLLKNKKITELKKNNICQNSSKNKHPLFP